MQVNTVAVIAAHPDDEILGCGGAVAKHVAAGSRVVTLIMAEGLTARQDAREQEAVSQELSALKETAQKANKVLGVSHVEFASMPDNRMDSVDRLDVIKVVEAFLSEHMPDVIYTHHASDVNVDHRRVHEAVVTACRPQPNRYCPKTILFFEIASSTEWQPPQSGIPFTPNWFVDISIFLEKKLKALSVYEGEMRAWPHARSLQALEHLARWRGATIGVEAAESFILGRQLG